MTAREGRTVGNYTLGDLLGRGGTSEVHAGTHRFLGDPVAIKLLRADLAGDAVELAAVLRHLLPEAPQVVALHALLLLQHSRRHARVDDGRLVTLADQDRSLWRRDEIGFGLALVGALTPGDGYAEELRLQALIAAGHARAHRAADTDWSAIAVQYSSLEAITGSTVVRLNRAVAVAEADGPRAGLALLDGLDQHLPGNHRLHAVRAELATRCGDTTLALAAYEQAITLCDNDAERAHLESRRRTLAPGRA